MYYAIDVGMRSKDVVEFGFIGDIAGIELGSLAAYQLDSTEDFLGRVVEVVDNDDFVTGFQ